MTLSRQSGLAEFPDSVTARGTKHLDALAQVVREGGRAVMLYLVQRTDCAAFTLAADIRSLSPGVCARQGGGRGCACV